MWSFLSGVVSVLVVLFGLPCWAFHGHPTDGYSMTTAMRGRDRKLARRA